MNGLEQMNAAVADLGAAFVEHKSKAEGKLKHAVEDARRAREIAERIIQAMSYPSAGDGSSSTTGKIYSSQDSEHGNAIGEYLIKGVDHELKDLGSLSDPDGGYFIDAERRDRLSQEMAELGTFRPLADVIPTSAQSVKILVSDASNLGASGGWVGETATRGTTASPKLKEWEIFVREHFAMPEAFNTFLEDSPTNAESWLTSQIAGVLSREEETAFLLGNGVKRPRGIITYADGTKQDEIEQIAALTALGTPADGSFDQDDLLNCIFSLRNQYLRDAVFVMNRLTLRDAMQLKDSQNRPIFIPSSDRRIPGLIFGFPVHLSVDMAVPAANSLSILFGDIREAYTIVERSGVSILRDPFTTKGRTKFYTTKRVGGSLVNGLACKILKLDTV